MSRNRKYTVIYYLSSRYTVSFSVEVVIDAYTTDFWCRLNAVIFQFYLPHFNQHTWAKCFISINTRFKGSKNEIMYKISDVNKVRQSMVSDQIESTEAGVGYEWVRVIERRFVVRSTYALLLDVINSIT